MRIVLKRPFADGTTAVDMDPLSLLCRLAASVPAPRFHTVRYAGVLAPAAKPRPRIVPHPKPKAYDPPSDPQPEPKGAGCRYRPWAELLVRTFSVDVLECDVCHGRMKLIALVHDDKAIARFLKHLGAHRAAAAPARARSALLEEPRAPAHLGRRQRRRRSVDDAPALLRPLREKRPRPPRSAGRHAAFGALWTPARRNRHRRERHRSGQNGA